MPGRSRLGRRVTIAGPTAPIPEKRYFRIGEAADLVGVETHVLRYWEREVSAVRPSKSTSNQRLYRRRDVELFREIRRLLHEERYTLAGARRRLAGEGRASASDELGAVRVDDVVAAFVAPPPEIEASSSPPPQLSLRLPAHTMTMDEGRLQRLRDGLRELIRLSGEDPRA